MNAQSVIAHPDAKVENLTQTMIRSIFLMRTTEWEDGTQIVVMTLEASETLHIAFCKNVLGLFPYQLQQIWDRIIFTGTGQAPHYAKSADELKKLVATTPGAIGYIDREDTDGTVRVVYVED